MNINIIIVAKKKGNKWEVYTHGGRNETGIDAIEFAKKMENNGAGELLVTSMDRDGTQIGYDIDLMSNISLKIAIKYNIFFCGQNFLNEKESSIAKKTLISKDFKSEIVVKNLPSNFKFNTLYSEFVY